MSLLDKSSRHVRAFETLHAVPGVRGLHPRLGGAVLTMLSRVNPLRCQPPESLLVMLLDVSLSWS